MKCPKCHSENPSDRPSCAACGAALPTIVETLDARATPVEPPIKEPGLGSLIAGKYRLVEELGKGGMGVVFLADQTAPVKRQVALKIIKLGMDTHHVVARFEAERQALAVMDHPNIAKVFDGGATDTGRPYFVMELVKGIPLTTYCDQNELTTRERLELFIPICEAVQHAHQKGVIHRDLKPSNVLVAVQDGKPVPKIIDFGIAKAIDHRLAESTLFTEQGLLIGTPAYMSPEQAEMSGLDIDTRTDIYSLGVMLYELLIGVLPFDQKMLRAAAFNEIQRIIREIDPPRASTQIVKLGETNTTIAEHRRTDPASLHRQLKGDLDCILMRAMEKDRTRRYETATSLAMDINRHLHNEPISARPPSTTYRLAKFARRHKVGLAAGVAVFLALVAGLVLATTGLIRAKRAEAVAAGERDRANQETKTTRRVSDFLVSIFQVSDPRQALGNTITAREILDKGAARVEEELKGEPLVKARLMDTMGTVYMNLGLFPQAAPLAERALEVRRQELAPDDPLIAESMNSLGALRYTMGNLAEAEKLFRGALDIRRKKLGEENYEVSTSLNDLAMTLNALGRYDEAEPLFRQALAIRQKLFGKEHPDIAQSLNNLGMFLYRRAKYEEAEKLFRQALEMNRRLLGEVHPEIASYLNNLGMVLRDSGQLAEAETTFRQSVDLHHKLYGPDHPNYGNSVVNLAALLVRTGKFEEAERYYLEVIALYNKIYSENNFNTATVKSLLGECLTKTKKFPQAEKLLVESLAIIKGQFGQDHPRTQAIVRRLVALYEAWGKPQKKAVYQAMLKK
ncbi:MAG: tetratricopeptide repeat protein [Candidatus Aminicenantes bacterium]|nr:tetratricopeptide repeat protein [Candidatus Aminicenantes bacterium]